MEKNRKNSKIEKIDDKNEEKWREKLKNEEKMKKNWKIEGENTKLKK